VLDDLVSRGVAGCNSIGAGASDGDLAMNGRRVFRKGRLARSEGRSTAEGG
jgi:hypothetical protein